MIQIIPAINEKDFSDIKEKIKLIEPYFDWAQLDVADGTFTNNTIWHNPQDLTSLKTSLNIEVHLMINDIENRVEDWFLPQIKRIIFHIETAKDPDLVIEKIKKVGKEPGMAVGPDGKWTDLAHFKNKVNFFQILGVRPGLPGQQIDENTYENIKQLKKFCEYCIIEVDGGVNVDNAKKLVEAGADILCAASAIFNGNIKDNIEKFKCL
ncbi:hypothetical protein KKD04_02880 [Patescibacteria group bacterium]|nr:hypothetical protein [Patescibacteria group bacterium]